MSSLCVRLQHAAPATGNFLTAWPLTGEDAKGKPLDRTLQEEG